MSTLFLFFLEKVDYFFLCRLCDILQGALSQADHAGVFGYFFKSMTFFADYCRLIVRCEGIKRIFRFNLVVFCEYP